MKTRTIVFGGLFAALYVVISLAIAPLTYGPIQLRVANFLNPVVLFDPAFGIAIALGVFLTDLASPFGFYDWAVMPLVSFASALLCWKLRRIAALGVTLNAITIGVAVSLFPLNLGGGLPFVATVVPVVASLLIVQLAGYVIIWRRPDIRNLVQGHDSVTARQPGVVSDLHAD